MKYTNAIKFHRKSGGVEGPAVPPKLKKNADRAENLLRNPCQVTTAASTQIANLDYQTT
jgi:hypothetical protein